MGSFGEVPRIAKREWLEAMESHSFAIPNQDEVLRLPASAAKRGFPIAVSAGELPFPPEVPSGVQRRKALCGASGNRGDRFPRNRPAESFQGRSWAITGRWNSKGEC
jgi:hypothetical protein